MPLGIRYMSQVSSFLQAMIPWEGKKILDKTLTGCGGTEFFGNSGRPLVLVSPRTGVLYSKAKQHPDWHLFLGPGEKYSNDVMYRLRFYLNTHYNFGSMSAPVILVTFDSAHHVIDELKFRGITDQFLFLVDEFQCLMCDAAFKGKTELNFLRMIDAAAKNICYMSATPLQELYLDLMPEFQGVDYYKLVWDPAVVVEPTVKKIMMPKGQGAASIMKGVIADYNRDGYFAKKIDPMLGVVKATELVVFVNEVKTIWNIIHGNNLKPDEVTILISSSSEYVDKFKKSGYTIENQIPDKNNTRNTTYTFCSKASFEGRDFYSNCAFTIIFLDGTKEWQTHDISIEIPQMLGRQRLDKNPFKYNAVIYYKTKPSKVSKSEYTKTLEKKMQTAETYIKLYQNGDDVTKATLMDVAKGVDEDNPYKTSYLDVLDNIDGTYSLSINYLVAASEHMLWVNKENCYSHPIQLTTAIQTQMSVFNQKTPALRTFEKQFDNAMDFKKKMELYCNHLNSYPQDYQTLLANPFIDEDFHVFYKELGPATLYTLGFDEKKIRELYTNNDITARCKATFISGQFYTLEKTKSLLQGIYNSVYPQNPPVATANRLEKILPVKKCQRTMPDGTRPRGYEIQ